MTTSAPMQSIPAKLQDTIDKFAQDGKSGMVELHFKDGKFLLANFKESWREKC